MKRAVVYIHGKGGNAAEAEHYRPLFPDCDVLGFDYRADTPWEAEKEFPPYFDDLLSRYDRVDVVANSIGAYFVLMSLAGKPLGEVYFISPVVDMEKLITGMMAGAGVSEEELSAKKEIVTPFGETLSWEYLCYAREHPVKESGVSHILYGENDELTSFETVAAFAGRTGASLTVMKGGEHWFHTERQMRFLDDWIRRSDRKV